jgi:hypothetical protein
MTRLAIVLLLAACGAATEPPRKPGQVPDEVGKLVERWQMCWHFSGEEPYDQKRALEIADGQAHWCQGNDAERTRLTAKYEGDAQVQDALHELDEMK